MNKKNMPTSRSLSRKLIMPIAFMILLQSVLFLGAILGAGTMAELNHNAFRMFQNVTENRKEQLSQLMVKKWSLYDNFEGILETAQSDFFVTEQQSGKTKMSSQMAEQLVMLLQSGNTSGAFVIYDDGQDGEKYTALYMRDMEPAVYSRDNADIFVAAGSGKLASEMGLSLDTDWTNDMTIVKDGPLDTYLEEIRVQGKENETLAAKDLGRWSTVLKVHNQYEDVILYSLPLIDDAHNIYGFVGIEITLNDLVANLPYDEISSDAKGGYILGVLQEDGRYKAVAKSSISYQNAAMDGYISFSPSKYEKWGMYAVEDDGVIEPALATIMPMRLYNSNTPFESEQWALIGIADKNNLLASGIRLQRFMTWAFVGALVIGAACSAIITILFSKPIEEMAKHLQKSAKDDSIRLPRVYVTEIDRLAEAVEKYSTEVAGSASRLSQVLHIMNQPLGAIEYDKSNQTVYCTSLIGELLNFSKEGRNRLKFSADEFRAEIEQFKSQALLYNHDHRHDIGLSETEEIYEDIVQTYQEEGKASWISFKTVEQQDKMLIVVQDVTEEISEKLKLEYERDYDLLTSLLNRRSFRKRVLKLIDEQKNGKVGAMVMWDLDNLKTINDTYGHDFGDSYICEAAKVLQSLTSDRVIVSRMSGDEFLVFFHDYNSKNEVLNLVRAVHNQLQKTILWLPGGESVNIRASAGIVWYPESCVDFENLIKFADFAMYSAKGNVKGELQEFNYEKYRRDELLFNSKDELNRFIDEKQMRFKFQPIVNARTGEVFAFEALMRPNGDNVKSIVEMMRLAKAQSKLNQIEFMTFMGVLEAYRWQRDAFGNAKLFFNSIPNNRLSMEDFATFKRRFGEDLHRLVIEITERERHNGDCLYFKQCHLKRWGVQVAIDNFASEGNTEIALQSLSPEYIKIDMSIVRNIDKDEYHQNKVAEILAYSRPRNIKSIAEGIETKDEMEMLMGLGIDYLQGYYIGRPSYEVKGIEKKKVNEIKSFYI